MPKIGDRKIKIDYKGQDQILTYVLYYDGEFSGVVPEQFDSVIQQMDTVELEKFNAIRRQKPRNYRIMETLISGETEKKVADNMKKLILVCMAANVKTRSVIIFNLTKGKGDHHWRGDDFESIKVEYKLGYYQEISGIGDKAIYKSHEKRGDNYDLDPENGDIVIEDTPAARAFFEDILEKLETLGSKLTDFLSDPVQMFTAINNGQKLLS